MKILAFAASQLAGASFQRGRFSQRAIIENTLAALLKGDVTLELEDLPLEDGHTVLGHRKLPNTVVLNRRAIPADGRAIGDGDDGRLEEHVGLVTLVHEVNHLCNAVPTGPTYAAFMDEYTAWYVAFVALMARLPTEAEALARVKDLFTQPEYADIQAAHESGTSEAKQIDDFMRQFGSDHFVTLAPEPSTEMNVTNDVA